MEGKENGSNVPGILQISKAGTDKDINNPHKELITFNTLQPTNFGTCGYRTRVQTLPSVRSMTPTMR